MFTISLETINKYIDSAYLLFPEMKKLNYQRLYVIRGVLAFLNQFSPFLSELNQSYYTTEGEINFTKEELTSILRLRDSYSKGRTLFMGTGYSNSSEYIINLDVGLGKTFTSILLANVLEHVLTDLVKQIPTLLDYCFSQVSDTTTLQEYKDELYLTLQTLKSEFQGKMGTDYPRLGTKIYVMARKNLCLEFQQYLKNDTHYEYFPSGRGLGTQTFSSKEGNLLTSILIFCQLCLTLTKQLSHQDTSLGLVFPWHIWIVDEYNSLPSSNSQTGTALKENYSYIIGLTADKRVNNEYNQTFSCIGQRHLKSDPEILKELTQNHLYCSDNQFFYTFQKVTPQGLEEKMNEIQELRNVLLMDISKNLQKSSTLKFEIASLFEEIVSDTSNYTDEELDLLIKKITMFKERDNYKFLIDDSKTLKEKVDQLLIDAKKMIKTLCYQDFTKIFEGLHLGYLLEQNTIIILDKDHIENIKPLKDWLKENQINVYTTENFRDMKGTCNVVIGTTSEISKGLNLQQFDNIVFSYIDNMTVNDIYQGIGRVDRIGTISNKNIVMLYHSMTERQIEDIVMSKDQFNGLLSLSVVKQESFFKSNSTEFKNLGKLIKMNFTENKEIQSKLSNIVVIKQDNDRMKTKIEFIQSNRVVFQQMISQINTQFDRSYSTLRSLMGGSELTGQDENYINTVLGLL